MIPYSDTIEDLQRHGRRVVQGLKRERDHYLAHGNHPMACTLTTEIETVLHALDALASVRA